MTEYELSDDSGIQLDCHTDYNLEIYNAYFIIICKLMKYKTLSNISQTFSFQ